MINFFKKIAFHSSGRPRKWLRNIFDADLRLKPLFRYVVYDASGFVRPSFNPWFVRVLQNPGINIDPQWVVDRNNIIDSSHQKIVRRICIVSPPATFYIAYWLRWNFQECGGIVSISNEMPVDFNDDLYFVVCPQLFNKLPPRDKRIIYQMEQSVTSRWFSQEYLDVLYNSLAVFDYAEENIKYMRALKFPLENLYHVPIQPFESDISWLKINEKLAPVEAVDVIFYGDIKNIRRQKFIKALSRNFKIKVVTNLYGLDLWRSLLGAKVIVNIHYYENALLETTRICECLSLGVKVVSEMGSDHRNYICQFDDVIFTPVDDIDAMVDAIREVLESPTMKSTEGPLLKYNNRSQELTNALDELNIFIA
jgi:hypothetical protein